MYLLSKIVCYMYMISIILMELLIIHNRFIFLLGRYYYYGGNIGFLRKHSMELSTIFIDHSDGIFARSNENVDGIK